MPKYSIILKWNSLANVGGEKKNNECIKNITFNISCDKDQYFDILVYINVYSYYFLVLLWIFEYYYTPEWCWWPKSLGDGYEGDRG